MHIKNSKKQKKKTVTLRGRCREEQILLGIFIITCTLFFNSKYMYRIFSTNFYVIRLHTHKHLLLYICRHEQQIYKYCFIVQVQASKLIFNEYTCTTHFSLVVGLLRVRVCVRMYTSIKIFYAM